MEAPSVIKPVFFGVKWTTLLLVASLGLSGCSLFGDDDELQVDTNSGEQQMYRQAQRYIDTFCDYLGMTEDEFWEVAEAARNLDVWERDGNSWKLRVPMDAV